MGERYIERRECVCEREDTGVGEMGYRCGRERERDTHTQEWETERVRIQERER